VTRLGAELALGRWYGCGMRAVRHTTEGICIEDVPEPEGDVCVNIRSVSICGSDLGMIALGPLPFTLGHEMAGELDDGTPVAVEPVNACGSCDQCSGGHTNRCRRGPASLFGLGLDGGMADRIRVPERCLIRLPAGIAIEDASVLEPLAVAVHGLRIAGVRYGQRVAVVGGGSIGLMTVAAARALDCEVALIARHPHQRAAADKLGATEPSGEYDLTVDAAGSDSAIQQAVELAAPGGTLLILGVYHGDIRLPGLPLLFKELRIINSLMYCHHSGGRDFDAAASLMAREPAIAEALVTHRLPLDDARNAFELAADRKSGAIKVVMHP